MFPYERPRITGLSRLFLRRAPSPNYRASRCFHTNVLVEPSHLDYSFVEHPCRNTEHLGTSRPTIFTPAYPREVAGRSQTTIIGSISRPDRRSQTTIQQSATSAKIFAPRQGVNCLRDQSQYLAIITETISSTDIRKQGRPVCWQSLSLRRLQPVKPTRLLLCEATDQRHRRSHSHLEAASGLAPCSLIPLQPAASRLRGSVLSLAS